MIVPRPSRSATSASSSFCNKSVSATSASRYSRTYGVLGKGERHVAVVTANLDKNKTELRERTSDCGLQAGIFGALRQAGHLSDGVFNLSTLDSQGHLLGDKDTCSAWVVDLCIHATHNRLVFIFLRANDGAGKSVLRADNGVWDANWWLACKDVLIGTMTAKLETAV